MQDNKDYIELVKRAQFGEKGSLDNLSERVRGRLYAYVYRIMLREDLSQDIVQESMLEMFNNFDKLEEAELFWPWLRGIAYNKIRHYYTRQHRRRMVSMSSTASSDWQQSPEKDSESGLAYLMGQELRDIVFNSMRQLKPKHRTVLAMRCYEEMGYSQIAELMDCSEFNVRVLFHRAKEALHRQLSRKGFGKGFLLPALALFGRMTAPSRAAAAEVSVTEATTTVGLTAGLVGVATSKTTVVALAAAGMLTAGTIVAPLWVDKTVSWANKTVVAVRERLTEGLSIPTRKTVGSDEHLYYYPGKASGPVMMRLVERDSQNKQLYGQWLENEQANYFFDRSSNTIYINNYRMWRKDLAVRRLPADSRQLRDFLSMVEGKSRTERMEYVTPGEDSLLVVVGRDGDSYYSQTVHHYNVLDEEYFRYNWPRTAKVVDNRDAMHRRGWTYFTITGEMNGKEVSGTGRVPFVYAASRQHYPWLKLKVADRLKIADGSGGATIFDADRRVLEIYPAGSFFKGLLRPWMGLHTIDTVRRDAAQQQVFFETKHTPDSLEAEVILTHKQNKIVYTVDLEKDVIEKITFLESDEQRQKTIGELRFTYIEDVGQLDSEFVEPRGKEYEGPQQQEPGILWLMRLVEGD
jgi:RNA polymerase sigma-70 factor (ECF subfamily)